MANIKLYIKGSKNPSTIYIRLYSGRNLDVTAKTGLVVNPSHWDNGKGNFRNTAAVKNRVILRSKIDKLRGSIVDQYNQSYMLGEIIDSSWLESACAVFFNRPKQEKKHSIDKHFIFFSDFGRWWLSNKAPTWKSDSNTYLSDRIKNQYASFLDLWENYQGSKKYKIWDIGMVALDEFATYCVEVLEYAPSTTKRMLGRARFFVNRASDIDIKTDPTSSNNIYVKDIEHDIEQPYLPEPEIQAIYDLDYSENYEYDNIRDNAIIGCWTGLRISDFNHQLDISNIDRDFIKIRTTKTGTWVTIPLHPHVKAIIKKRFGALPAKSTDEKFNQVIKKICLEAGITNEMNGGVVMVDPNTGRMRKKYGVYQKYQLITSHICRRSFATNLFGQVSNSVIMSVAGWKNEEMLLHYIKKTKLENAMVLKKHWDKKYRSHQTKNQ